MHSSLLQSPDTFSRGVATPCRSPRAPAGAASMPAGCHRPPRATRTRHTFHRRHRHAWDTPGLRRGRRGAVTGTPANAAGPAAAPHTAGQSSALTHAGPNPERFHQLLRIYSRFAPAAASHLLKKSLKGPKKEQTHFLNATLQRKSCPSNLLCRGDVVLVVTTIVFYLLPPTSPSARSCRQAAPFKNSGHKWEPDYISPTAARKQLLYEAKNPPGIFPKSAKYSRALKFPLGL